MVDVSGRMEVEAEAEAFVCRHASSREPSAHPAGLASATKRKIISAFKKSRGGMCGLRNARRRNARLSSPCVGNDCRPSVQYIYDEETKLRAAEI
jgi:hypothetical protein